MLCYAIKISYSFDSCEDLYGNFKTPEEAYKEACRLACKEAYTQNEEFEEDRTCDVAFNAYRKEITLHYDIDDKYCYYEVVDV